jgi:hypothetical protein
MIPVNLLLWQLVQNLSSHYVSVCTLPDSASGNLARALMNTMIQSNTARIEEITKWFDEDPSSSTIP